MPAAHDSDLIRHLCRGAVLGIGADTSDGRLLESFITRQDNAAFAALVRRHGRMVFGVCRRVIGHTQDAEDAFQATFPVLAQKAAGVRPREAVGKWLYGVAYRKLVDAVRAAVPRRGWERDQGLTAVAEAQAAGSVEDAVKTAQTIEDRERRNEALLHVAAGQAARGEVEAARQTAEAEDGEHGFPPRTDPRAARRQIFAQAGGTRPGWAGAARKHRGGGSGARCAPPGGITPPLGTPFALPQEGSRRADR